MIGTSSAISLYQLQRGKEMSFDVTPKKANLYISVKHRKQDLMSLFFPFHVTFYSGYMWTKAKFL